MTTGVWLVRPEAEALGVHLARALGADVVRPWLTDERPRAQFARAFHERRAWVLVMTTGIATRYLEGLPVDKRTDPAVVVLDEAARYAVSLLSGHEGGANALAYTVANATGATPVITTATEATKPLVLGIGCRKGVPADTIEEAVQLALGARDLREVREVGTIDLKAREPGLLDFCARHALPLRVYRAADLTARPWVTAPSAWVQRTTGAVGVCEPCALLGSPRARLITPKTTLNGVAVAVATDAWEAA
ncbi:cobalamin biosynthesis protein [Deinococcus maricopensis]|uniref:Cobalamin (Vitamin B12) biosynthesis CbiG protein n=1 Tax=Deinococcus maricopensis (strain DSM 21211 / LMG 22137 / NRRL B-23946 / LB-34) TaxID=709986 RepID=E8U433_DEIML|nr:cobalamin biosynthesis protein [Deinococcus maricopensis]ADV65870.1 cobalamin (vitamin B12) biosynthesis CbiG protein [Deinococcus maricopensis DSM 21211]